MKNNQSAPEKEAQKITNEYHFAGGMEYKPMTVKAESYEEALKIWESKKESI